MIYFINQIILKIILYGYSYLHYQWRIWSVYTPAPRSSGWNDVRVKSAISAVFNAVLYLFVVVRGTLKWGWNRPDDACLRVRPHFKFPRTAMFGNI